METVPYKQALIKWSSVCPNNLKFKATGSFIYEPISKGVLKCLQDKMMSAPKDCRQFYDFKGLSGNVSKIKPDDTAFVHRNSLYLIEVGATWDLEIDREDNIALRNY